MPKALFSMNCIVLSVACLLTACKQPDPPFECTDAIGCVEIAPGAPLRIGVIQSLSGRASSFGLDQLRAIRLAVAERGGQLLGHPVDLQEEDEKCSPEGGVNAALKIVTRPDAVAILGTTCSGAAAPAARVMSEAGLVMISGQNAAPSLTAIAGEKGENRYPGYFRTIHNGAGMGEAAAVFCIEAFGRICAATIDDGGPFTRGVSEAFHQMFTRLGGKIALPATINTGDEDMRPVLSAVAASGAEFLFLSLYPPDGIRVVRQVRAMKGLEKIILMGSGVLKERHFIEMIGNDGRGMYFAASVPPSGAACDELTAEFEQKYGEPPKSPLYTYGYDAACLLLSAIEATAIRETDGTLRIGRQALRDTLYATADFKGVTGRLTCNAFGDCGEGRFNIVRPDDPTAGPEALGSDVLFTYTPDRKTGSEGAGNR